MGLKRSQSLAESAYRILKNKITYGYFSQGEEMLEESLSSMLGMSRTPVRTALAMLESEGLLEEGAARTLRVPLLDLKSIEDTFHARALIETAVASLAADKATEEQISRLENIIWEEKMANAKGDEPLTGGLDRLFHAFLAEIADNSFFIPFSSRINARVSLMLSHSNTLGEAIVPALEEHRKIVDAIRRKDPPGAESAMKEHLGNVVERMKREVDKTNNGAAADDMFS
jgi:DNA-binding GntR family transcriptional regulator